MCMTPIDPNAPVEELKQEAEKEKNVYIFYMPGLRANAEPGNFEELMKEADYIAHGLREMGYDVREWTFVDLDKWPVQTEKRVLTLPK